MSTADPTAGPSPISVTLPDGQTRELPAGSTGADLAAAIGPRLAQAAIAVVANGAERDLGSVLPDGAAVSVVTASSEAGRAILRHSTSHVLAQAVTRLWPGARYAIGPAIEDGFYYDFELPGGARFSEDDLARIEATMREIMDEDQRFVREEHSVHEGLDIFADQPYKREIIEGAGASHQAAVSKGADGLEAEQRGRRCRRGEHLPQRPAAAGAAVGWRGRASSSTSAAAPTSRPQRSLVISN